MQVWYGGAALCWAVLFSICLCLCTVMSDSSGVSRGFGFVRFTDPEEQQRAMSEMQGVKGCGTKPLRVSPATSGKKWGFVRCLSQCKFVFLFMSSMPFVNIYIIFVCARTQSVTPCSGQAKVLNAIVGRECSMPLWTEWSMPLWAELLETAWWLDKAMNVGVAKLG